MENTERFGGSLAAPYRTEPNEKPVSKPAPPALEDERYGGNLASFYAPRPPREEPVAEVPALVQVPEPVVAEPVVAEPVVVQVPVVMPETVAEIEVSGGVDAEEIDPLYHDVEDEHVPQDSKHSHNNKNKKRR